MSSEALERADGREIQHALNVLHGIQQGSFQRVSVAPALAELAALLAALAVAREREQRATDGCEKAAETFAELAEALTLLRHPTLAAACQIAEAGTRAALEDEQQTNREAPMTEREALTALATPPPEPFRQVMWKRDDFVRWDEWNAKRIEALNVAAADEPGETP